jgi:energy-coupling factor transporter ATP-binding protein EcfA2
MKDRVCIKNIKGIAKLEICFEYPESNLIVITGKNGLGKTSVIKAFSLTSDPSIFQRSAGLNALRESSEVRFEIEGFSPFLFEYNQRLGALDSKDILPLESDVIAELPIPYGRRFQQFSLIASHDSNIRANIASSDYEPATNLIYFLHQIYSSNKFSELKLTRVGKYEFYFFLLEDDFYIREDHLSSGEFFLIQLYRLITSGAKLILIDEIDVALDASAQANLYAAIKSLLMEFESRLILVSHSLAFMQTIQDGGLYYLENLEGNISLENRSFAYIKSDLYGFSGSDRYILTEDEILEGFINFIISYFSVRPFFQYRIIGVGGVNQLGMIIRKNDVTHIFSKPENVQCIVDADSLEELHRIYGGPTEILASPVSDIERYIYQNRESILPQAGNPNFRESSNEKRASKTYWKWLTKEKGFSPNYLFQLVIENNMTSAQALTECLKSFLELTDEPSE